MLSKLTHPHHAFRVKAVHGLIQNNIVRIAQQRHRYSQTLPHTERESAHFAFSDRVQAGHFNYLVHASERNIMRVRDRT